MGRIAEALRKAEQQRLARIGGAAGFGTATLALPLPVRPAAAARREPTPPSPEPVACVAGMSESVVAYYERSSPITEQYRALRTRLLSHNPLNEHRILAITSSAPGEGKTITTVNLAFALAEVRHLTTLVVDADFRRSALAGVLNLRKSPGLAELLAGEVTYPEVIQPTPIPNLHVVAAGDLKGRSAPELLSAITTRTVFRWFESRYHFTVVDTPPVTTVTDAGIIGPLCSGVILVVRMHQTAEPLAKRAIGLLQANRIPLEGCVLIGRDERGGGYGPRYEGYRD